MPEDKEALRKKIDMLAGQNYVELPEHEVIGRRLRMVHGDRQFFNPGIEKVKQTVKRELEDGEIYYVVYGHVEDSNQARGLKNMTTTLAK